MTLLQLEELSDERISAAVSRFLDDVSEPARFHAMITLLAQSAADEDAHDTKAVVMERISSEESGRIRAKMLDTCSERGWTIAKDILDEVRSDLPTGYKVSSMGKVSKG